MTLLAEVLDAAAETLRELHGVPILYVRGTAQVPLVATLGRTVFTVEGDDGLSHEVEARDYLVAAGDLRLGGQPVVPAAGDRILETRDGAIHVYELRPIAGAPVYRASDVLGRTLRLHALRVASGPTVEASGENRRRAVVHVHPIPDGEVFGHDRPHLLGQPRLEDV